MNSSRAGWISAAYAVAALVWILFSDSVLFQLLPDRMSIPLFSAGKGFLFVLVTASALYLLLCRLTRLAGAEQLAVQRLTSDMVFKNASEGIIVTDADSTIVEVNPSFERVTGYRRDEVIGKSPRMLHSGFQNAELYRRMWASINTTGQWQGEIWNRRRNGEAFPEWLTINAVRNSDGVVTHYIGMFSDLTSIKKTQQEVEFLAYHDPLTKLPNRRLICERINSAVHRARPHGGLLAVMYLDVDRFKIVNAGMGYTVGDEVLCEMARRVQKLIGESDTLARVGGDEFAVLLEEERTAEKVGSIARAILRAIEKPLKLDAHVISVTTSIGISLYPDDGETADQLLGHADRAMAEAKREGRNAVHFYSPELTTGLLERVSLEAALRAATASGQLRLHYQPQIDLRSGAFAGVEALVRWEHPEHGMIAPGRFIPMAEEIGVIHEIGDWVLEQACAQQARWLERGVAVPYVAVNLSVRQLELPALVTRVAALLERYRLEPSMLELELTESIVMESAEHCRENMRQLRALGVKLAIDDFGTGYSSLAYLKRLPLDRLKIDRSFVQDIGGDADDEAIVRAMIAMARSLGLDTVGEGVEEHSQLQFLAAEGCAVGQGYLFSRPVPAEELEQWLLKTQVHL